MKKTVFLMMILFAAILSGAETYTRDIALINGGKLHIKAENGSLQIDKYKGKVVLMEVWGVNCPPCLMSIPHYKKLISKYKNDLGMVAFEVPLAMFPPVSKDDLLSFAQVRGINYDVVYHDDSQDFLEFFSQAFGWDGNLPFLIILDRNGKAVAKGAGMPDEQSLENFLLTLMKQKDAKDTDIDMADQNRTGADRQKQTNIQ